MKTLTPLILKEDYYAHIEDEINEIFFKLIYAPLIKIAGEKPFYELENSISALKKAIQQGRVWYYQKRFHGEFNATISKELKKLGAIYLQKYGAWALALDLVPSELKFAQATADARYQNIQRKMLDSLNNINIERLNTTQINQNSYTVVLTQMELDLDKTIPKTPITVSDSPATARTKIAIEAKLTEEQKRIISEKWAKNLDLYIKKWVEEDIISLREKIEPSVLAGGRAENLIKEIQKNYNVSKNKAKFLARQETALLMSKFQETRYADMGLTRYKWSTTPDSSVRHDHKELNGKAFAWSNPPITDKKTGARNNPGEDYNCRCVAIPIID